MALGLRAVVCAWEACGQVFLLCSACDRGRKYCSQDCRGRGRQESLQRARRKYAVSAKGKEKGRERQKRWRCGLSGTVTDHSSRKPSLEPFCWPKHCPHGVRRPKGRVKWPRCACCGRPGEVVEQVWERGRFR